MNTLKKKLVTGAIVAAAVAVCCPAALAMGGPGGGQMGGGMSGGGQMGGGMQMQQSVGQSGMQQSGGFSQTSFTQQAQSVDTVSSATTQSQQNSQNQQNTQTQQGQTQNSQMGQSQMQNGQMGQGQMQNGQMGQGQMPGMNGQQGQQGGLLESIASAVGVSTTTTASTDKSASADTLVSSIKTAVEALDSDELAALAEKYNIDTTDKTDAELVTAIEALLEKPSDNGQGQNGQQGQQQGMNGQQGGLLESIATAVGVDTDSDTTDADTLVSSIKTAVEALDSDELAALAEKYNIDTTDKTDAELVTAIEALLEKPSDNGQGQNGQQGQQQGKKGGMLEALAADAGVTVTSGEKPEAIVTAIKTAVEALDSDDLATLAEKYDIDTTDKTDAELVTAIEALLTPPTAK